MVLELARPEVFVRKAVTYPNISAQVVHTALNGNCATWPRLLPFRQYHDDGLSLRLHEPTYSSGVTTSSFIIGSFNTGLAFMSSGSKAFFCT